jgi:hypothetical protein
MSNVNTETVRRTTSLIGAQLSGRNACLFARQEARWSVDKNNNEVPDKGWRISVAQDGSMRKKLDRTVLAAIEFRSIERLSA